VCSTSHGPSGTTSLTSALVSIMLFRQKQHRRQRMQILHQNPYAKLKTGLSPYIRFNEDSNNIGDAGLLHFSKGKWAKLNTLSVSSKMGIGWMIVGGYSYLIKGNWSYLATLRMGNYVHTQKGLI
jgi:hypothetical protein